MASRVNLEKEIFTTFDVAKICHVNITSIKNWIEQGKIRAFRTPGGHWRIEKKTLMDFLDRHGMPNPFIKRHTKQLVVVTSDPALTERLRRAMGREVEVTGAYNALEAAFFSGCLMPECVVVDLKLEGLDGLEFVKIVRSVPRFNQTRITAFTNTDSVDFEHEARAAGVDDFVRHTDGFDALVVEVGSALR